MQPHSAFMHINGTYVWPSLMFILAFSAVIEILQVQISKSKSEVAKSKNVGRDNYVLRVRFDNWAQLIDQREKWVELLVQSA